MRWQEQETMKPNLPSRSRYLLDAYAQGRRDFRGWRLIGVDLSGADLHDVNFAGANLALAKLVDTHLEHAD
ncbi:MAG TPA: pentapeptide repeat-containing protein, partial [Ktedonobacterales bacterium]|nr:pentapeptide repeat-containing protein [Ktedonobacterales bacterium]